MSHKFDGTSIYTSPLQMLQCFCFTDSENQQHYNTRPSESPSPIIDISVCIPGYKTIKPVPSPSELMCSHYEGSVYNAMDLGEQLQLSMCWQMLTYSIDTYRVWGTSIDLFGVVRAGWRDEGEALDWPKEAA